MFSINSFILIPINIQYENIKFICMSFSRLFCSECKLIVYLTTMYVYCDYPAISKSPKQLPDCLKIAKTSVVLIVFNGVICEVSTCTVTFCRST